MKDYLVTFRMIADIQAENLEDAKTVWQSVLFEKEQSFRQGSISISFVEVEDDKIYDSEEDKEYDIN